MTKAEAKRQVYMQLVELIDLHLADPGEQFVPGVDDTDCPEWDLVQSIFEELRAEFKRRGRMGEVAT